MGECFDAARTLPSAFVVPVGLAASALSGALKISSSSAVSRMTRFVAFATDVRLETRRRIGRLAPLPRGTWRAASRKSSQTVGTR